MSISFLHDEVNLYGDSGYIGAEKRQDAIVRNKQGKKIRYKQNCKPTQIKKLSASGQRRAKKAEHQKSSVRAKVEHVFAVIKGQFRYRKTRYRGLPKQTAKLNMLFALANLVLADRRCPAVWPCAPCANRDEGVLRCLPTSRISDLLSRNYAGMPKVCFRNWARWKNWFSGLV